MKNNLFTPKLIEVIAPGISTEYLDTSSLIEKNSETKNFINQNL
jgi:hypothetical protein